MNKGGNYVHVGMRKGDWEGESKGRERKDYTGLRVVTTINTKASL